MSKKKNKIPIVEGVEEIVKTPEVEIEKTKEEVPEENTPSEPEEVITITTQVDDVLLDDRESVGTTTEEVIEEPVVEEKMEDLSDIIRNYPDNYGDKKEETPDADVSNPDAKDVIADPLPEVNGQYYCKMICSEADIPIIGQRLEKFGFPSVTTATGDILVGPYVHIDDANLGKRQILARGLRADVVSFEEA